MKFSPTTLAIAAGAVGLGIVALYVWKRGVAGAAADVGGAAVSVAGGVATGVVSGVSSAVGLPTPAETTTDAGVARWIIDHPSGGYFEASKWAGAGALVSATLMSAGSGTPPPAGSGLAALFPVVKQAAQAPAAADDSDWWSSTPGGYVFGA